MKFSHQPKARLTNEAGLSCLPCSLHAFPNLCAHLSTLQKYSVLFGFGIFFPLFQILSLDFSRSNHNSHAPWTQLDSTCRRGRVPSANNTRDFRCSRPQQPRSSLLSCRLFSTPAGWPLHDRLWEAGPPALPASPHPTAPALVPCGQRGGWERAGQTHLPARTWQRASPWRRPGAGGGSGPGRRQRRPPPR